LNDEILVGKWISILDRCRKSYANRMLEPYGLAGCQYLFLLALNRHNGVSQEKISDFMKIDKTTTAKSIKALENNGFVVRQVDAEDKRAYKVFLTQKAVDVLPVIRKTMRKWEDMVISDISKDDYIFVEKILSKMAGKARQQ
jgi:Transcriptional regulators